MALRWTKNDTLAYEAVSDAGKKGLAAYKDYQMGQMYEQGRQGATVSPEQQAESAQLEEPARLAGTVQPRADWQAGTVRDNYAGEQHGPPTEAMVQKSDGLRARSVAAGTPTDSARHQAGMRAQMAMPGLSMTERGALQDRIDAGADREETKAWRQKVQGRQEKVWTREDEAMRLHSTVDYSNPDSVAEAAQALSAQGDTAGAAVVMDMSKKINERQKALKNEGIFEAYNSSMIGAPDSDVEAAFAKSGKFKFDQGTLRSTPKLDKQGKIIDVGYTGTIDGKPVNIPSMREFLNSALDPQTIITNAVKSGENEATERYRNATLAATAASTRATQDVANEQRLYNRGRDAAASAAAELKATREWLGKDPITYGEDGKQDPKRTADWLSFIDTQAKSTKTTKDVESLRGEFALWNALKKATGQTPLSFDGVRVLKQTDAKIGPNDSLGLGEQFVNATIGDGRVIQFYNIDPETKKEVVVQTIDYANAVSGVNGNYVKAALPAMIEASRKKPGPKGSKEKRPEGDEPPPKKGLSEPRLSWQETAKMSNAELAGYVTSRIPGDLYGGLSYVAGQASTVPGKLLDAQARQQELLKAGIGRAITSTPYVNDFTKGLHRGY